MWVTKISIVKKKVRDITGEDFVMLYNHMTEKPYLVPVYRNKTFLHKHRYIEIDYDYDYDPYFGNAKNVKRFYDCDDKSFDVIQITFFQRMRKKKK